MIIFFDKKVDKKQLYVIISLVIAVKGDFNV